MPLRARMLENGEGIRFAGGFEPEALEYLQNLPGHRFDMVEQQWSCDDSPITCHRLAQSPMFECDPEIRIRGQAVHNAIQRRNQKLFRQPLIRRYDSWDHQGVAYEFANALPAVMLAMDMGTGKSKVCVDVTQNLASGGFENVLVGCPSTVTGVWRREFDRHCVIKHVCHVVNGRHPIKRRMAEIEKAESLAKRLDQPFVLVVNYEMIFSKIFLDWALRRNWMLVALDESHRIKGPTGKTARACNRIGNRATKRLCLTGTPMPHSPLDVFSQYRFLDSSLLGDSVTRFRSDYAITGKRGATHIVAWKNQARLGHLLDMMTYRVAMEDTDIVLPPVTHSVLPVTMEPKTRKIYEGLRDDMVAWLNSLTYVTPANALSRSGKLRQITGGFVIDQDRVLHSVGAEKQKVLEDYLRGIHNPCVVMCCFTDDIRQVLEVGEKLGMKCGEISGNSKSGIDEISGEMHEGLDLVACQIQATSLGVNLCRAKHGIFWNHPWSRGELDQAYARIRRPEQTDPVTWAHLVVEDSIDEQVWRALEKRADVIRSVLVYLGIEREISE